MISISVPKLRENCEVESRGDWETLVTGRLGDLGTGRYARYRLSPCHLVTSSPRHLFLGLGDARDLGTLGQVF